MRQLCQVLWVPWSALKILAQKLCNVGYEGWCCSNGCFNRRIWVRPLFVYFGQRHLSSANLALLGSRQKSQVFQTLCLEALEKGLAVSIVNVQLRAEELRALDFIVVLESASVKYMYF